MLVGVVPSCCPILPCTSYPRLLGYFPSSHQLSDHTVPLVASSLTWDRFLPLPFPLVFSALHSPSLKSELKHSLFYSIRALCLFHSQSTQHSCLVLLSGACVSIICRKSYVSSRTAPKTSLYHPCILNSALNTAGAQ